MKVKVSKSEFKARALEYFRYVERTGETIVVTDRGKPVVKIIPYREDVNKILKELKGTIRRYIKPTQPVGEEEWEILKK